MRLSLTGIKEIPSGVVRIFEKDGAISFSRFTEAEETIYSIDEGKRLHAVSTPGIRLWLKTDATELNLGVLVREKARPYFSVEVFSNDKFIGEIKNYPDDLPNGKYPGEEFPIGAYGINDWVINTDKETFEANCRGFWENICKKYPLAKKVLITPIWTKKWEEEKDMGKAADMHKITEEAVSELSDIRIINGWELVPHDKDFFGDENIHPNNLGFDEYFENLISKLDLN